MAVLGDPMGGGGGMEPVFTADKARNYLLILV
jgi:hypothetical protein